MFNINTTMILGFVLGVAFALLLLDNLYLRRKIFKMYERLIMENKKKSHNLNYDKILKDVK